MDGTAPQGTHRLPMSSNRQSLQFAPNGTNLPVDCPTRPHPTRRAADLQRRARRTRRRRERASAARSYAAPGRCVWPPATCATPLGRWEWTRRTRAWRIARTFRRRRTASKRVSAALCRANSSAEGRRCSWGRPSESARSRQPGVSGPTGSGTCTPSAARPPPRQSAIGAPRAATSAGRSTADVPASATVRSRDRPSCSLTPCSCGSLLPPPPASPHLQPAAPATCRRNLPPPRPSRGNRARRACPSRRPWNARLSAAPRATCATMTCPAGKLPDPSAKTKMCSGAVCSPTTDASLCCKARARCSSALCPAGRLKDPTKGTKLCAGIVCTDADASMCCKACDADDRDMVLSHTWCGPSGGLVTSFNYCKCAAWQLKKAWKGLAGSEWKAGCLIHDDGPFARAAPSTPHQRPAAATIDPRPPTRGFVADGAPVRSVCRRCVVHSVRPERKARPAGKRRLHLPGGEGVPAGRSAAAGGGHPRYKRRRNSRLCRWPQAGRGRAVRRQVRCVQSGQWAWVGCVGWCVGRCVECRRVASRGHPPHRQRCCFCVWCALELGRPQSTAPSAVPTMPPMGRQRSAASRAKRARRTRHVRIRSPRRRLVLVLWPALPWPAVVSAVTQRTTHPYSDARVHAHRDRSAGLRQVLEAHNH